MSTGPTPPVTHRWSGWPGAFCWDCGIADAMEEALGCTECVFEFAQDSREEVVTEMRPPALCAIHAAQAAFVRSGCPPTAEATNAYQRVLKEQEGACPRS